jgi:hypothetical protein
MQIHLYLNVKRIIRQYIVHICLQTFTEVHNYICAMANKSILVRFSAILYSLEFQQVNIRL